MISTKRLILAGGLILGSTFLTAVPAAAQATRTWVSGVGDDVNPCSRTAPCKTFAGAISKTAAGGEINCLDPGGYGTVNITKSMTIDCRYTNGSSLASSTTGIIVNGANVIVVLRGLAINGGTPSAPGLHGVRFLQGASLTILESFITGFTAAAPSGNGISFVPSTVARLYIRDTVVSNSNIGLFVQPTGTGNAQVMVENSQFSGNSIAGIKSDTTGNTNVSAVVLSVSRSTMTGNGIGAWSVSPVKEGLLTVANSTIANNTTGVQADGTQGRVFLGGSLFTGNTTVVNSSAGGEIRSFGDNYIVGNGTTGIITPPALSKL
jgi:hypothetical protein